MHTDQGAQFKSDLLATLCSVWGMRKSRKSTIQNLMVLPRKAIEHWSVTNESGIYCYHKL